MSGTKSTSRAKLKVVCQEERLLKWNEHLKNLHRNCPEITAKPIQKFINCQLDIKLGQFSEEELDAVLKTIKSRKTAGLEEILTLEEKKI